jgi:hypothetical protein
VCFFDLTLSFPSQWVGNPGRHAPKIVHLRRSAVGSRPASESRNYDFRKMEITRGLVSCIKFGVKK